MPGTQDSGCNSWLMIGLLLFFFLTTTGLAREIFVAVQHLSCKPLLQNPIEEEE